jgi:hypothetical protein
MHEYSYAWYELITMRNSLMKLIRRMILATAFLSTCALAQPGLATHAGAPWWKGALFYEIYPRSFADSNGDGVGDLNGITQHLDYLQHLGVDAIWITPMYPSPQVDFGYDISNYETVDPQYGTLADFDQLISTILPISTGGSSNRLPRETTRNPIGMCGTMASMLRHRA